LARLCLALTRHGARGLRGVLGVVFALALLAAPAQAGARYFVCEAMGLATHDPCGLSDFADGETPGDEPEVREHLVDCCDHLVLPQMPDANAGRSAEPLSRPPSVGVVLVALVPSLAPALASAPRSLPAWRLRPRPPGARQAALMVFLT
jgi:hypothetical protein